MKNKLSIVIPLFNEEKSIPLLFKSLNKVQNELPKSTEIILVDDGSTDSTLKLIETNQDNLQIKTISFSRNFGHQAALLAGLHESTGDFVVTIDGDSQHPFELIPEMLSKHHLGYDVVLTERIDVNRFTPKSLLSHFFYHILNKLSGTKIPFNSSDFRSMSREALNALLLLQEKRKFLRGMVSWIGFRTITLQYQVAERKFGTSKYSLSKMLLLAIHGITSFSVAPLYAAGIFSLIFFTLAFLYGCYVVYVRLILGYAVEGWTSVILVQLIIGGVSSLFLGLLGVYLAAIYEELKSRPIYIKRSTKNVNKN